ncbi:putative FKBP-type peptidyl-prolyl cis-trans isomerase 1 [Hibiscus syriacus]|uniref:FKBP-type peptidyl-prolyl cis-trans isomerase 1 n=1 Tax=Hibiscus syriacus TaxID=106335 RepID=A0A6A2YRA4_HIBSY|nr:putative FKBP-type peptidyl-prolyl cis-trans isomerase 1 [Hibiscus syriacus]
MLVYLYGLGSKALYVARAQKKAECEQKLRNQFEERRKEQIMKYKASNVYVKNIDEDVTDDELRDLFSLCGTITSAKLMRDDKGINKGFGFVCFHTPEEAAKAVGTFHGYMFYRKPLYVAIAQRKEDRRAQLQLQYAHRMAELAGPSTAILPGGYPPLFYTSPTGIVSQMYQPLGLRTGWRGNGLAPPARPVFQPSQPLLNKGSGATPAGSNSVALTQGTKMLSSMLSAASPEQQKTILGERLCPLIQKHRVPKITGMLLEMDNSELLLPLESPESSAAKVEEAAEVLKLSNAKVDALHPNFLSAGVAVN